MDSGRVIKGLLILCAVVCVYSGTFQAPFIFDDTDNILQNVFLFKLSSFPDLWRTSFLTEWSRLRIVGYFSFALNYYFGGHDVFGYHLVNFLIHCFNGVLVFFLCRKLLEVFQEGTARFRETAAFLAAAIFLLHPLQTQAVTYIVQRFTSLAAFFYLAAFLSYLNFRFYSITRSRRIVFVALFLVSSLLGCLTKENVFSVFVMIFAFEWIFAGRPSRKFSQVSPGKMALLAAPVCVLLIVLAWRLNIFQRLQTPLACASDEGKLITSWTYFLTQPRVLLRYAGLLVFPVHQNFDYQFKISETVFHFATAGSFFIVFLMLAFAVYLRKQRPVFSFLIFWFFVALSVESSFIPLEDVIFEHRVYLPLLGFALAVPLLVLGRLGRSRFRHGVFFLLAYLLFFSALSFQRNQLWRDPVLLWKDVVRKSPEKSRARHNLALALDAAGKTEEARTVYYETLELKPCSSYTYNNLGLIYWGEGRRDKARDCFEKEFECGGSGAFAAHNNLGLLYAEDGNHDAAAAHFHQAVAINPYWAEPYVNLGEGYERVGDFVRAREFFQTAAEAFPHNMNALKGLLRTCLAQADGGCLDGILEDRMNVKGDLDAYLEMSAFLALNGSFETAQKYYHRVMRLFPKQPSPYAEYGKLLANYNFFDEAVFIWTRAAVLFPDNAEFAVLINQAETLKGLQ